MSDEADHHERKSHMHTANVHRSNSASEVVSGGDSDTSSSEESGRSAAGGYAEGRTSREVDTARARKTSTALCPTPVRMAVGAFSALTALAGAAVAIVGGNQLNHPGDPQADVHRAMLGTGIVFLALGACGALATFVRTDNGAVQTTPA